MITDYIGGEGSAETPRNDYVIYGWPLSYNYKYSKRKMSWPWGLPFPLNLFSFHSYSGKIEHVTAAGVHWDGQSKGRHIGGILQITGHCLLAKLIFNELWPKSLEKEVNDHIHCIYKDKGSGRLGYYTQYILNPHLHCTMRLSMKIKETKILKSKN